MSAGPGEPGDDGPSAAATAAPDEVEAAPAESEDEPRRDRQTRGRRSLGRRVYAGMAALGVIVGALAGTLALFDDVRGLFTDEPPPVLDARIDNVVQTRSRMPLGEYLRVAKLPTASFSKAQLDQPGYEFTVSVTITGRLGTELPLRWHMFRRPETPLPAPIYDREAVGFEPGSATHANSWPVWVPYPPRPGAYYVHFTLEDEHGLPASQRDSADFTHPPPS